MRTHRDALAAQLQRRQRHGRRRRRATPRRQRRAAGRALLAGNHHRQFAQHCQFALRQNPGRARRQTPSQRASGDIEATSRWTPLTIMKKIAVIGCGAIGSLFAAHLSQVAEVHAFVRRADHARALNQQGLRISGTHDLTAKLHATNDPAELPDCDLGIVATKANETEAAFAPVGARFAKGAVISAQNGLGSEEVIAAHTKGFVIRATTFMSGTRHSDTHVQHELNTPTWLGPFEPTKTPFSLVKEAADLINKSGLKAEALEDARPAQWAKLVFNASVNSVSALTELVHSRHYAD